MGDPAIEILFILTVPYVAGFSNYIGTVHFYILDESEVPAKIKNF